MDRSASAAASRCRRGGLARLLKSAGTAGIAAFESALAHLVGVGLDDVDLPGLATGAVDPDLVLEGVAAGGVVLLKRGETCRLEAVGGGGHRLRGVHLDAKVVQAGVLTGLALDEDGGWDWYSRSR